MSEEKHKRIAIKEHRMVERNILKLLLEEERFIPSTKSEISLCDFQDERIRDIMSKVYELYDQGKKVNCLNLTKCFHDQDIQQMISEVVAKEFIVNLVKTVPILSFSTRLFPIFK